MTICFPSSYLSTLLKETNKHPDSWLTGNMFCFFFYSSFIICHGDGFLKWQFVFMSVQLFIDLSDTKILSKMKKKKREKILRYDPAPSNLHAGQRLLVCEDKAHWRISKIFIILAWWYILLIHHCLLMAVTIWSPPAQAPCISLRHLFSFFLQTWRLEDHYTTYIGSFYEVLSRLDPFCLSVSACSQHILVALLLNILDSI